MRLLAVALLGALARSAHGSGVFNVPVPRECLTVCNVTSANVTESSFEHEKLADCDGFILSKACVWPLEDAESNAHLVSTLMHGGGFGRKRYRYFTDDAINPFLREMTPVNSSLAFTKQAVFVQAGRDPLGDFAFEQLVSARDVRVTTSVKSLRVPALTQGYVYTSANVEHLEVSGSSVSLPDRVNGTLKLDISKANEVSFKPITTMPNHVDNVTVIPATSGALRRVHLEFSERLGTKPVYGKIVKDAFCGKSVKMAPSVSVTILLDMKFALPTGLPDTTMTEDLREGVVCLFDAIARSATDTLTLDLEVSRRWGQSWVHAHVVEAWSAWLHSVLGPLHWLKLRGSADIKLVHMPPLLRVHLDGIERFSRFDVNWEAHPDFVYSKEEPAMVLSAVSATRVDSLKLTVPDVKLLNNGDATLRIRMCNNAFTSIVLNELSGYGVCALLAATFASYDDAAVGAHTYNIDECSPSDWTSFEERHANDADKLQCRSKLAYSDWAMPIAPTVEASLFRFLSKDRWARVQLRKYNVLVDKYTALLTPEEESHLECRFDVTTAHDSFTLTARASGSACEVSRVQVSPFAPSAYVETHVRNATANGDWVFTGLTKQVRPFFQDTAVLLGDHEFGAYLLDLVRRGDVIEGVNQEDDVLTFVVNVHETSEVSQLVGDFAAPLPSNNSLAEHMSSALLHALTAHVIVCNPPDNRVIVHLPHLEELTHVAPEGALVVRNSDTQKADMPTLRVATACRLGNTSPPPTTQPPSTTQPVDDKDDDDDGAVQMSSVASLLLTLLTLLHCAW
ncbi:MAG: hypothetical protein MHM6MM_003088 [Cercozoa sp. M6MM]